MASLHDQLVAIESKPASEKYDLYNNLLDHVFADSEEAQANRAENITAVAESLLGDSLGIVASRPLLASWVNRFRTLQDAEVKVEVGQRILERLAPKVVSYEEQDTQIKEILADAYETQDDFRSSAKILQTITLDSSQKTVSNDDKARVWVRIVRCYLEEEDPTSAFSYLNRVKNVIFDVHDPVTRLMFQLSQARIFDSQRQFLEASQTYYILSQATIVDEEERLQALSSSIVCGVLAPAGPQRAKTLAKLYKDERATQVEEFSILEKMFLDRIISPAEVKAFAEKLKPHHLAKTADGSTVLDKAVLEHNLLAASRLYQNIAIDNLGVLLGTDAERAESYAAAMMESDRLSGSIDQIAGIIHFNTKEGGKESSSMDLRAWDANIQGLAEEVEKVTTMLQREEAGWYEAYVAA